MKNRVFIIFLFVALFAGQTFAQNVSQLESLYKNKQFFDLRDAVAVQKDSESPEIIFYRGAVAAKFNRIQESNSLLQNYLTKAKAGDANIKDAYELLAGNYFKIYQYHKSAKYYKILLDKFKNELDAKKAEDIENSYKLWNALADVSPQTISFAGNTHLQASRDKARLLNVPMEINAQKMDFVFDTGANISTVSASTAQKLGLKIIEADIAVGSSTDIKVKSKLGVAPEMKIGQVMLKNVVFLVLEDKALSFPQINYQINGIVGFPVIEAFRELTLTGKDELVIPAQTSKVKFEQNMFLDELMPVVLATYSNRKMFFSFDTGAQTSAFYPAFYKAEEAEIKKIAKLGKVKSGGAGGYKEVSAYILENPFLTISGKQAAFKKVEVLIEPSNEDSRYFYGNLGQDFIRQFGKMTLNFDSMSIVFE